MNKKTAPPLKPGRAKIRASLVAVALQLVTFTATSDETPRAIADDDGNADIVPAGKSLFNQYCSHCHGPNAVQGERPRDLRRLKLRYGENWRNVFRATVDQGRLDKGMPSWKDSLNEETLSKIGAFLVTVQQ
ncbi:MAG: c-type cytochrome [Burkholderiales bacterium]